MLIHRVYASSASHLLRRDELLEILRVSRRNNEAAGVTGLLLYDGGNFIQVLEGPEEAVDATYARVERDPRHGSVLPLLRQRVERRYFGGWAMGFRHGGDLSEEERAAFSPLLETGGAAALERDPQRAHKLLDAFCSVVR